jgi:hypothetical protein
MFVDAREDDKCAGKGSKTDPTGVGFVQGNHARREGALLHYLKPLVSLIRQIFQYSLYLCELF